MIYHQFMEVRKTHWHEGFLLRVWQRGRKLDPSVVIPCSGWPAGIIGGAPCSPGLMRDIIFQTGIKEITVSLNFNNNSVVWDIIATFFSKLVFTEKENMQFMCFSFYTLGGAQFQRNPSIIYSSKNNKLCVNKSKSLLENCHNISKSLLMRVITTFEVKRCT